MTAAPTLTDRLAGYRSALDAAIDAQARDPELVSRSGGRSLEDAEIDFLDDRRRPRVGSRVVIGTAAAVVVGGLTVITFGRPEPESPPAGSASTEGVPSPAPTVDTTPATTVPGGGASLPCDPSLGDPLVPVGTLYLGGPSNEQNLARPGAIFSLPDGVPVVDVAARAIGVAVIGYDCNITTSAPTDGRVSVTIDPPAAAARVTLDVRISESDDAVEVTAITGSTDFETNVVDALPTLTFREALPPGTARVQVRFKKGDDVWELTANATPGVPIDLSVPAGETDRFPDQPVDWVLFTALDSQGLLLDAGGALVGEQTAGTTSVGAAPSGAMVLDALPPALADATGYSYTGATGLVEGAVGDVSAGGSVPPEDVDGGHPSIRWFNARPDGLPPRDGEPMLWLGWSVEDPELLPLRRLEYATVVDTTVRDVPAFIATNDPAEHVVVFWSEGGFTYSLGGFGLDQDTVLEAARQLRPATNADWAELEVEPG